MWGSDELGAGCVRELTTTARGSTVTLERLWPLLVRQRQRARYDREYFFLERQLIDISSLGAREQSTLPEIQLRGARRPLESEWSVRLGHRRLESAGDLAGDVVADAEPIAPVARAGVSKPFVPLRPIVNRHDVRIGEECARPFVTDPHARPRKDDDAIGDCTGVAERWMIDWTAELTDRRPATARDDRVDGGA
jgi:hypothetical protein